jgi:N utilization substance protein B
MSRRTARKHIMNILFQTEFHTDATLDSIIETYSQEVEEIDSRDLPFIKSELDGINANSELLTDTINSCAEGWTVDRMSKLDVAILKIAIYEMLFCEDIPDKVSANEAVELAKEYSADKMPGFINGVLGKVMKSKG